MCELFCSEVALLDSCVFVTLTQLMKTKVQGGWFRVYFGYFFGLELLCFFRVRHNVRTEHIVEINRNLIAFQREMILQTPFKWMVEVEKVLDISSSLLRELMSKWSADNNAFGIRKSLVHFSLIDVCFGLGLWVVGEEVKLENDGGGGGGGGEFGE
ncbi:hypothetical protein VNO80_25236 [Phaseolus coccineus]|uniref:Uncharacterized protein n=1 Tax=Phaseolus coccineus TaxID=3886 RepID=A0AAN9QNK7_PHACN